MSPGKNTSEREVTAKEPKEGQNKLQPEGKKKKRDLRVDMDAENSDRASSLAPLITVPYRLATCFLEDKRPPTRSDTRQAV